MDLEADPCNNFFNFTCGNYINKELPETLGSKSTLSDVRESNTLKLKGYRVISHYLTFLSLKLLLTFLDILEEPISETEPNFIKQTKVYYKNCTDKGSHLICLLAWIIVMIKTFENIH